MTAPVAIRNLKGTPHIHAHYLEGPDFGLSRGYMRAELVCHACFVGTEIAYDYPREERPEEPALTEIRHAFQARHRHAGRAVQRTLGTTQCRKRYSIVRRVDLRRYGRWTPLLRRLRIR